MKKILVAIAMATASSLAFAGSPAAYSGSSSSSSTNSNASSGAMNAGNNQSTSFNSGSVPDRTRATLEAVPSMYTAPSAFGFSQNNCGGSDTATVGTYWFGIGASRAKEMFDCNVRADTIILYQLGLQQAAKMRMACFGSDLTRKAFESSGGVCPKESTAKGIEGAKTSQNVALIQSPVQQAQPIAQIQPMNQQTRVAQSQVPVQQSVAAVPIERGMITAQGVKWSR